MSSKKIAKRIVWTAEEENRLIQVWEKNNCKIRPFKRNTHVYKKITAEMGGKFCVEEVHTKIRNLKQKYNVEKKNIELPSRSPTAWEHYERIHKIVETYSVDNEESFTKADLKQENSNRSFHATVNAAHTSPSSSPTPQPIASLPPNIDNEAPLIKRIIWTADDEARIIELWKENNKDLRQCKRNAHIYEKISTEMNHKFNRKEVHTKIRNLTARYKTMKKEMDLNCERPTMWENYHRVQEIIESWNNFGNSNLSEGEVEDDEDTLNISSFPKSADLHQSDSNSSFSSIIRVASASASPSLSKSSASNENKKKPSPSSAKKIKLHYQEEMTKAIKGQTDFLREFGRENLSLLRNIVDDNKRVTNEIINLIRDQNETDKLFFQIVENLLEK